MKRFTVVTALFSVSLLAVWVTFQASGASPAKSDKAPIKVHDAYSELLQVAQSADKAGIPVTGAETRKIAPVFDATGMVVSDPTGVILGGIYSADVKVAPVFDATGVLVSDPTGTILGRIDSANVKIAPIFDTTGAVMSDPTGTILGAIYSGNMALPVTGADVKIAPVFDATGVVVSDPTGTLLNVNPK